MSGHTPGPWFVSRHGLYVRSEGPRGPNITELTCFVETHEGEARANARLIAAAPELLEALRSFAYGFEFADLGAMQERARAVIAKAEGR